MAKVMLVIKLFSVWAYYGFLHLIIGQISTFFDGNLGSSVILSFLVFVVAGIFMPEIMFVTSKAFRGWISKNVRSKEDLKDAGILYVSLWSMRIFMWFGVMKSFGAEIDTFSFLIPLFGSFGIAGITLLRGGTDK